MTRKAHISVTLDGKTPTWEIVVAGASVYRFEGVVELLDFLAGGTSAVRYVEHEVPARMKR